MYSHGVLYRVGDCAHFKVGETSFSVGLLRIFYARMPPNEDEEENEEEEEEEEEKERSYKNEAKPGIYSLEPPPPFGSPAPPHSLGLLSHW